MTFIRPVQNFFWYETQCFLLFGYRIKLVTASPLVPLLDSVFANFKNLPQIQFISCGVPPYTISISKTSQQLGLTRLKDSSVP